VASHYEYALEFHQSHTDGMMTYSSAWWDGKEMSIEEAQVNKYSRILSRIGPPPQHILDMGCGWGHFIKVAASRGYTVLTVSRRKRSATVAVGTLAVGRWARLSVSPSRHSHLHRHAVCAIVGQDLERRAMTGDQDVLLP
jgi:cyclopropane-fatty-acyl-phospholipid synthase